MELAGITVGKQYDGLSVIPTLVSIVLLPLFWMLVTLLVSSPLHLIYEQFIKLFPLTFQFIQCPHWNKFIELNQMVLVIQFIEGWTEIFLPHVLEYDY